MTDCIKDIDDLLVIQSTIDNLTKKHGSLVSLINENKQVKSSNNASTSTTEQLIVNDILDNAKDLSSVYMLQEKYKKEDLNFRILNDLEKYYLEQNEIKVNLERLSSLDEQIEYMVSFYKQIFDKNKDIEHISSLDITSIIKLSTELKELVYCKGTEPESVEEAKLIYLKFDDLLIGTLTKIIQNEFNIYLLDSKWDTSEFYITDPKIPILKKVMNLLASLSECVIILQEKDNNEYPMGFLNSLTNNFKIRFIYHFTKQNDIQDIEIYFKFVKSYLHENLIKCIEIFSHNSKSSNLLSKKNLKNQFILNVLIILKKNLSFIKTNDSPQNISNLLYHIIMFDGFLFDNFNYSEKSLTSSMPHSIIKNWVNLEVNLINKKFTKIFEFSSTNNGQLYLLDNILQSSSDFKKLIINFFNKIKPFFNINDPNLTQFKLILTSDCFMNLFQRYLDTILETDFLSTSSLEGSSNSSSNNNNIKALKQTILKLQSIAKISKFIHTFSNNQIFIVLTDLVNKLENKSYISLYQDIQKNYQLNMRKDIAESIITRTNNLLKDSLSNYKKLTTASYWSINEGIPTEPTSELIESINLLKSILILLNSTTKDVSNDLFLKIKMDVTDLIIKFYLESIWENNKFNETGIKQMKLDFTMITDTWKSGINKNDIITEKLLMFNDLMKLISAKYEPAFANMDWWTMDYVKNSDGTYPDIKAEVGISYLNDREIQDALYRIAYDHII